MNAEQSKRLAGLRADWTRWSTVMDTSSWDSTFFFNLIDELYGEVHVLRKLAEKNPKVLHTFFDKEN